MSGSDESLEWANYAEEDLIMAKSALRHRKPLTTASCFHSQQCAEKYFTAILVAQDVEFPKTHDLLILNTLCTMQVFLQGLQKKTWEGCQGMPFTLAILETNLPSMKQRRLLRLR